MSWHRLLAGSTKYAVLIAFAAFYLVPFYVMILTGLKPLEDISSFEIWNMPKSLDFGSFREAWNQMDTNFWNSVRITIPGAIVSTFLGSLNGYVFAKWGFRGSNCDSVPVRVRHVSARPGDPYPTGVGLAVYGPVR